jgi:hypothetical protein
VICGDTEVGGFGVAAEDDLLYVEDVVLVKQSCTPVSVCFEDESVADYFDMPRPTAAARRSAAPGSGSTRTPAGPQQPSTTDEDTFARVFGECEWAVMFIIAEYGETYARLAFHSGPGGSLKIPVEVDFQPPFAASDEEAWESGVPGQRAPRGAAAHVSRRARPLRRSRAASWPADGREYEQDLAWDSYWDSEDRFWREEVTPYG